MFSLLRKKIFNWAISHQYKLLTLFTVNLLGYNVSVKDFTNYHNDNIVYRFLSCLFPNIAKQHTNALLLNKEREEETARCVIENDFLESASSLPAEVKSTILFKKIPTEIHQIIQEFLPIEDLKSCSLVNQKMNDVFWQHAVSTRECSPHYKAVSLCKLMRDEQNTTIKEQYKKEIKLIQQSHPKIFIEALGGIHAILTNFIDISSIEQLDRQDFSYPSFGAPNTYGKQFSEKDYPDFEIDMAYLPVGKSLFKVFDTHNRMAYIVLATYSLKDQQQALILIRLFRRFSNDPVWESSGGELVSTPSYTTTFDFNILDSFKKDFEEDDKKLPYPLNDRVTGSCLKLFGKLVVTGEVNMPAKSRTKLRLFDHKPLDQVREEDANEKNSKARSSVI